MGLLTAERMGLLASDVRVIVPVSLFLHTSPPKKEEATAVQSAPVGLANHICQWWWPLSDQLKYIFKHDNGAAVKQRCCLTTPRSFGLRCAVSDNLAHVGAAMVGSTPPRLVSKLPHAYRHV